MTESLLLAEEAALQAQLECVEENGESRLLSRLLLSRLLLFRLLSS